MSNYSGNLALCLSPTLCSGLSLRRHHRRDTVRGRDVQLAAAINAQCNAVRSERVGC
jgi:hypothetical protein